MSSWQPLAGKLKVKKLPDVGAAVRRVIGHDNRQPVLNTTVFPASAIAHLIITAANGHTFGATGTFIRPRLLLTAGHALHVAGNGPASGGVKRVVVVPGRNGQNTPFGAAAAQAVWAHPHWRAHAMRDFDCGLVMVAPPPPSVGTFGVAALTDQELQDLGVAISGYPVDKLAGTQWFDARTIVAVSPGQVAYDADTEVGQSGAPVFSFDGNNATIVAIHQFGDVTANYGTRLRAALLADLQAQRMAWGV